MADASVGCGCESVMRADGGVESGVVAETRAEWGGLFDVSSPETEETDAGVVNVWCVLPSELTFGDGDLMPDRGQTWFHEPFLELCDHPT